LKILQVVGDSFIGMSL